MEKAAASKAMEITVISAEGLLVNRKQTVTKNVSVTVKTDPLNSRSTGRVDPEGGSSPSWKEKLLMDLPVHARFITVEVHSGSRIVGAANIPVTDFSGGFLPENHLSFLSYRLRDGNGERNGIVNLSVKVRGAGNTGCAASCSRPWIGVPGLPAVGEKAPAGMVTGIPVPYKY
ncbi:hypothetical protein ABFS83_02G158400 [Erythranthe nasuta]